MLCTWVSERVVGFEPFESRVRNLSVGVEIPDLGMKLGKLTCSLGELFDHLEVLSGFGGFEVNHALDFLPAGRSAFEELEPAGKKRFLPCSQCFIDQSASCSVFGHIAVVIVTILNCASHCLHWLSSKAGVDPLAPVLASYRGIENYLSGSTRRCVAQALADYVRSEGRPATHCLEPRIGLWTIASPQHARGQVIKEAHGDYRHPRAWTASNSS